MEKEMIINKFSLQKHFVSKMQAFVNGDGRESGISTVTWLADGPRFMSFPFGENKCEGKENWNGLGKARNIFSRFSFV